MATIRKVYSFMDYIIEGESKQSVMRKMIDMHEKGDFLACHEVPVLKEDSGDEVIKEEVNSIVLEEI